jgi:hypothetical protein
MCIWWQYQYVQVLCTQRRLHEDNRSTREQGTVNARFSRMFRTLAGVDSSDCCAHSFKHILQRLRWFKFFVLKQVDNHFSLLIQSVYSRAESSCLLILTSLCFLAFWRTLGWGGIVYCVLLVRSTIGVWCWTHKAYWINNPYIPCSCD